MSNGGESLELEISSSELEAAYKEQSALDPLWPDALHIREYRINWHIGL